MMRRHAKGGGGVQHCPGLRVVSGNYVAAKSQGIVDGVDYMFTGMVGNWCIVAGISCHPSR